MKFILSLTDGTDYTDFLIPKMGERIEIPENYIGNIRICEICEICVNFIISLTDCTDDTDFGRRHCVVFSHGLHGLHGYLLLTPFLSLGLRPSQLSLGLVGTSFTLLSLTCSLL